MRGTRRLLIGLLMLVPAAAASAAQTPEAEARRLLTLAIEDAAAPGSLGFRLRCAAGCEKPRAALRRLRPAEVVKVTAGVCRARPRPCYRVDLERKDPVLWWTVEIEPRQDAARPIARVTIMGP